MIDDGVSPERASGEPDPVLGSLDALPVLPDDDVDGSLPEVVIDFGESPLEGLERSESPIEPELALTDLWGEPRQDTGPVDALDLELGADTAVEEDWWGPAEGIDGILDPEGGAVPVGPPVAPLAPRRPKLAPAPVAIGRSHALRRSLDNLHLNRRLAAVGLAGVAAAGLFAILATRSSDDATPQRQVVSAGTRPVASVPSSSVPASTTTTVASTLPAAVPAPVAGEAPTTVVSNGSPPPPTTAGQAAPNRSPTPTPATSATTAPPRSNPTVAASPPPSPSPPPAPPATRAPATVAPPDYEEPETPPTTRRPRVTIPETTAVPNTTTTTNVLPGEE